jgi:hypothetical protein
MLSKQKRTRGGRTAQCLRPSRRIWSEWMENDLAGVASDDFRENSDLPVIIAKSVLSALAILKTQYKGIHTGEYHLTGSTSD